LQTVKGCDSIITLSLTVNSSPTAAIYGDSTVCPGESATLTAIGGTQYLWSTGSTEAQISDIAGSYTVIVTNENGCTSTASFTVGTINPELSQLNILSKNKTDGTPYMLIYPQSKLQYQWLKDGVIIEGENKQYYYPLEGLDLNSCYTVHILTTEPEQCGVYTNCWNNNTQSNAKMDIIPNPTDGHFYVMTPEDATSMQLYSVSGQLVFTQEITGENRIDFSLTLPNGLYLLKTTLKNGNTYTEKLIINK
jgi:hypothetical protein